MSVVTTRRFRFHVPAIPHTVTNEAYVSCAYTQKVRKLCGMLLDLGHEVYHYGCEGSNVRCTEHVDLVSADYRSDFYDTDYTRDQFSYDIKDEFHQHFHTRCIAEITRRKQPRDFLLCAWGWGHEPIARGLPSDEIHIVESGIGYENTFAQFRVFESYTWMAHVYGLRKEVNGSWYDCVIPNFFDPDDFEYRAEKEDWYLYLGRIVHRKGVDVAAQVTREIGANLRVAGQGSLVNPGENLNITDPHVEHIGFADAHRRRDLLARAKAVFMPTYYIEPFGGVSIEAALSGTPVLTSDWGVFAENVLDGITGFRCRTLDQFCKAALAVDELSPSACRAWAMENFSLKRVATMYQEYFEMLDDLWTTGWYERRPEKPRSTWLQRAYPADQRRVNISRRPRIAVWTQLDWAFGRIYGDLKQVLEKDFEMELLDWTRTGHNLPGTYDLIKIATADTARTYERLYGTPKTNRLVATIHGKAELISYDDAAGKHIVPSREAVDAFTIQPATLRLLESFAALSCVSNEIKTLLALNYGFQDIVSTPVGFLPEVFYPAPDESRELRVLFPLRRNSQSHHHYDTKRIDLVLEAERRLSETNPTVRFIFPERLFSLNEMADFYRSADIHVCVSHSEGGPLVGIESAGCGLVQISTPTGVMSELIEHGETGFLLAETDDDKIIGELCERIRELDEDRHRLARMKAAMAAGAHSNWTWETRRDSWRVFFQRGLER